MNNLSIFTFKVLRKLYTKILGNYQLPPLQREEDPNKISDTIYKLLVDEKPCMIARFGAFELNTIINYIGVQQGKQSFLKYIKGEALKWWWDEQLIKFMNTNAGFFPPTQEKIEQFCELMLKESSLLDILISWQPQEYHIKSYFKKDIQFIDFEPFNPYFTKRPWTRVLEGKKVLVIHPFSQLIRKQYQENRSKLFDNPNILPEFELQTIQAVQSLGGVTNNFTNWFEALHWMENEVDKHDFDIALIGCGAYGFPLAAYVKRKGKKAVHFGGSLQLLFGIRGNRWENPNYNPIYNYANLMNEYWVKPGNAERPQNAEKVENACYW